MAISATRVEGFPACKERGMITNYTGKRIKLGDKILQHQILPSPRGQETEQAYEKGQNCRRWGGLTIMQETAPKFGTGTNIII